MIPLETEALYLGYFLNGFLNDIKHWVRLMGLDTRIHAFNIARNVNIALGDRFLYTRGRVDGESLGGSHVPNRPPLKNFG